MNKFVAYLNLFRWRNLLFFASLMVFFRLFIILPLFDAAGVETALSHINFSLLVLASLMVIAAGYAINDYFDVRKDRINRPDKIIVGRVLPRRTAILSQWILNTFGGLIGIYISWYVKYLPLAFIFVFVPFLLWLYGVRIKRSFLLGNIFISALSALIVFLVWAVEFEAAKYIELPQELIFKGRFYTLFYSVLFFFMFFALEVVKDFLDFEGDKKTGVRTFPVVLGKPMARNVYIVLLIVAIQIAGIYVFWLSKNFFVYSVAFFVFFVIIPLAILIFLALKPMDQWRPIKSKLLLNTILIAITLSIIVQFFYIY